MTASTDLRALAIWQIRFALRHLASQRRLVANDRSPDNAVLRSGLTTYNDGRVSGALNLAHTLGAISTNDYRHWAARLRRVRRAAITRPRTGALTFPNSRRASPRALHLQEIA